MTLEAPTAPTPPRTFVQWLAAILRVASEQLDPSTITVPSLDEIRREKLRDVCHALLDAEAEEERARHTVALLRERKKRLSDHDPSHSAVEVPESPGR
jgi:hypothetical protein